MPEWGSGRGRAAGGNIRGNIQIVHIVHSVHIPGRIGRSGRIGRIDTRVTRLRAWSRLTGWRFESLRGFFVVRRARYPASADLCDTTLEVGSSKWLPRERRVMSVQFDPSRNRRRKEQLPSRPIAARLAAEHPPTLLAPMSFTATATPGASFRTCNAAHPRRGAACGRYVLARPAAPGRRAPAPR
jgi:hypothetical protein